MNESKRVLDALRRKQKQLQDSLRHIEAVIKLYETEASEEESVPTLVPLQSLKGLTQIEALEKIAKASPDGRFRIADARALLIRAGLINSPKGNEANILYNAINRSEKFERVGHGEYRLKENPNKKILSVNQIPASQIKAS